MSTNPLQIAPKSQLLEAKARAVFQSLVQEYRQGTIRSKEELMAKIYAAVRSYYTTVGLPTIKLRTAAGIPSSDDFNAMLEEQNNDIGTLFAELKLMSKALEESFTYVEMDRQMLSDSLDKIQDEIRSLTATIEASGTEVVFRESFMDRSHYEIFDGTLAAVSLEGHALTLNLLDSETVGADISIKVLATSNGFPGDTHRVRAINSRYKFYGEDNLHLSLADILDGSADTWYEYEVISVAEDLLQETGRLGFNYREGISWVKEDDAPLRLVLEAEFPAVRTVNWLSITPFLPADRGVVPAKVVSVVLDDGKGTLKEIANGESLRDDAVYLFAKQRVKRITLTLEQSVPYETLIGHIFFKEIEQSGVAFFEQKRTHTGRRVDGPVPSIETLGFQYDPSSQTAALQPVTRDDAGPDRVIAVNDLFSFPDVVEQVGLEALPAMRYAIGVRDIALANFRFGPTATYISKPFTTTNPILSITLDTDEWVPQEFGPGSWIEYAISIDGGQNYHPIASRGSIGANAKVEYAIGSSTPAEGRSDRVGYLDPQSAVYSARLKVTLNRPTDGADVDYYTPILKEYRLNIRTEGGR